MFAVVVRLVLLAAIRVNFLHAECDPNCASPLACSVHGPGTCDRQCTFHYGLNPVTFKCERCDANCAISCLNYGPGKCDGLCNSGWSWLRTGVCVPCSSDCNSTCNDRVGGNCDGACIPGYGITDGHSSKTCAPCDANCASNCTLAGQCDSSCNDGFGIDRQTRACRPCDDKCTSACNDYGPGRCDAACKTGYTLNTETRRCQDFNECSNATFHNCSRNAACSNTIGSYTCTCELGFSGDGFTCIAVKVAPRNVVVLSGSPVTMRCRTNITNPTVTWRFVDASGTRQVALYDGQHLDASYATRNVTVDHFDLKFAHVMPADAGTYTCQDSDPTGRTTATASMAVLDANPQCSQSDVDVVNDLANLTCTVSVYGPRSNSSQLVPAFTWFNCPTLIGSSSSNHTLDADGVYRKYVSHAQIGVLSGFSVACSFGFGFEAPVGDAAGGRPSYAFVETFRVTSNWSIAIGAASLDALTTAAWNESFAALTTSATSATVASLLSATITPPSVGVSPASSSSSSAVVPTVVGVCVTVGAVTVVVLGLLVFYFVKYEFVKAAAQRPMIAAAQRTPVRAVRGVNLPRFPPVDERPATGDGYWFDAECLHRQIGPWPYGACQMPCYRLYDGFSQEPFPGPHLTRRWIVRRPEPVRDPYVATAFNYYYAGNCFAPRRPWQ